jgi:hypothetical protein
VVVVTVSTTVTDALALKRVPVVQLYTDLSVQISTNVVANDSTSNHQPNPQPSTLNPQPTTTPAKAKATTTTTTLPQEGRSSTKPSKDCFVCFVQ